MQERTLLISALLTACIGIAVLFVMPQTPPVELRGEVAWSNGTLTRLLLYEEVWVEHEHALLPTQSCVLFAARPSFSGYTNARALGVQQQYSQRCH